MEILGAASDPALPPGCFEEAELWFLSPNQKGWQTPGMKNEPSLPQQPACDFLRESEWEQRPLPSQEGVTDVWDVLCYFPPPHQLDLAALNALSLVPNQPKPHPGRLRLVIRKHGNKSTERSWVSADEFAFQT